MEKTKFLVFMVEYTGDVIFQKHLVGRFVCKGDAIAYAIWRRDTMPGKRFAYHWWIEDTKGDAHAKYEPKE